MTLNWLEQAQKQREEFLQELIAFLSINSVEDLSTATEGKPFGEGVAEALTFLLNKAAQDDFRTKNLDGYAGYIEFGDGEEEIGVLAHVDVVPVGEGWTTPPFSPDIRDGRIYARGAIDDKGPALTAYYAMKIVRDSGLPLSKRVRFLVGTDEESGWLCMRHYEKVEKMPEIGFSPDADFPIIHAEKGQINPTLVIAADHPLSNELPGALRLLSFSAGDLPNMVPDHAAAVIETTDPDLINPFEQRFAHFLEAQHATGLLTSEGHQLTFTLEGKAAHGMEPFKGKNAGTLLAMFLNEWGFVGKDKVFLSLLGDMLHEDHYGERLGLACADDVTGALTVNAGLLQYTAADGARIKLNIRYPATISAEERVEVLTHLLKQIGWQIAECRTSKSHYVPKDHPVIQTLQRVYHEQTGEEPTLLSTGGATYARSMKYGVAFGAVFPGMEMTAHQKDEYADIEGLVRAMSLYAQAIYELAK